MGKSKSLQSSTPQNHTKAIIQASMRSVSELKKIWCVVEASNDKEVYDTKLSDVVILTSEDENGDKGYHNVESIVSEIQTEFPKAKIFGIRDSDYTRFVSSYSCPKNVFLTDEHGIEMMMLSAPSVKEALMADESKLFNTLQESADAVRPLGYLRIYNEVNDTKCRFA